MQFEQVLGTFTDFFVREDIPYLVIGGLAVHAWGFSRTTQDVDFAVDGSAQRRVIAYAESLGFKTVFVTEGYSNHDHPSPDFGFVDFMYVYGETARAIFARSERKQFASIEVPVPSPEHLIAMKITAIKNNGRRASADMRDIEYLISLPGVDRSHVRDYFRRSGLLKLYDDYISRGS